MLKLAENREIWWTAVNTGIHLLLSLWLMNDKDSRVENKLVKLRRSFIMGRGSDLKKRK